MTEKARRGFAAMKPELQRALSARGGKRAHELRRAHQWTSDEARRAGIRGGHRWLSMTDEQRAKASGAK